METQALLRLEHITKIYPGVVALDDVSLDFHPGEVHAIVGENGAGKSTFIKTITGAISPSEGVIHYDGRVLEDNSPLKSLKMGIVAIYQEFNLFPFLSVAENVCYGNYPRKSLMVDFKEMERRTGALMDELGIDVDPKTTVKDLSVGYQQIVEIAKAVSRDARVLIMDEPSAPLTNNEVACLFRIIRTVKAQGVAVIYISHRLEEIFEICDKVSVFRDGHYIKTMPIRETNADDLVRIMVNRELGDQFPQKPNCEVECALEVKDLCGERFKGISFEAKRGEILGFAGLVGAGRTEIARALFGADPIASGEVTLDGKRLEIHSPSDAIMQGIGLIPEDRKRQGILLGMSVLENISYANMGGVSRAGVINARRDAAVAEEYRNSLQIKTPTLNQLVRNLSGGNQQKVVLAKWMFTNCKVMIFDEPTRGIDVGAKQEIYRLMQKLASKGVVIIMISSEMPELLGMADRIIVLHEGRIAGILNREEATQEKILTMASGLCPAS